MEKNNRRLGHESLASWFWRNVEKTETCWNWLRCTRKGYGRVCEEGKKWLSAHRYAWEEMHGPVPPGKILMHTCDNRRCVRPDHLKLGTDRDNMVDRNEKLRQARHEKHGFAKITMKIAEEIRRRYAANEGTTTSLGNEYGLSSNQVSKIVRFINWKPDTERSENGKSQLLS